jgi:hypothetical protein
MEGVLNGYVTNPNPTPTPTLTPNSNPNQINEKIQKETTLEIDQITKCQFGRWKLVKTYQSRGRFVNYDKYRVFPTSIFMPGFRDFVEETHRNIAYSPKIYIIERFRKINRGR